MKNGTSTQKNSCSASGKNALDERAGRLDKGQEILLFFPGEKPKQEGKEQQTHRTLYEVTDRPVKFPFKIHIIDYIHSSMRRIKPDVDIILDVLDAVMAAKPDSSFVQSIRMQYLERGGLSRKQLEGLHAIAGKTGAVSNAKLATLEAIILKKPVKTRSEAPPPTPLYQKDEILGLQIRSILEKYPQHKRVLFFQSKYENNEPLNSSEIAELQKFTRLLK